MTSTKYTDKIPAQLPPDIKVAHKIGVYERKEPSTSAFSDCGIVYFPDRPFLLCMMAEGDENGVRQHMSQIAKMIYEYIASVTVNK